MDGRGWRPHVLRCFSDSNMERSLLSPAVRSAVLELNEAGGGGADLTEAVFSELPFLYLEP